MINDREKTKFAAQKFKIDKRKKNSIDYFKLFRLTKLNKRIIINEKKIFEQDFDQLNSIIIICDSNDEIDFFRIKTTIKFEIKFKVSVVKKLDF